MNSRALASLLSSVANGVSVSMVLFLQPMVAAAEATFYGISGEPNQPLTLEEKALAASMRQDMIWLMLSLALLLLSFFLLRQGNKIREWVDSKHENGPHLSSGVFLSAGFGFVAIVFWTLYSTSLERLPMPNDFGDWLGNHFHHPRLHIPGYLIASLIPSVLAVKNFWIAWSGHQNERAGSYSMAGIVIGIINFASSIATLVGYYESH